MSVEHRSDCAIYNEPAFPAGPCNCGTHRTTEQTVFEIAESLKLGGSWLGAARDYVQRHCVNGSTVTWGSDTPMNLTMRELEDMALIVAARAIKDDRSKRRG